MAIGTTINDSVPVVGTTVHTYNRANGNTFTVTYAISGGGSYLSQLSLRPAGPTSKQKRFGATLKMRPSEYDDPGTLTNGAVSVTLNIDATIGSELTETAVALYVRHAISTWLKATLIEDLMAGTSL